MTATADRTYDRVNTSVHAKQYFKAELEQAMEYFQGNANATGFAHLHKCMIVWQQFNTLQSDRSLHNEFMGFLDEAPHVPMGTWGNMVCLLTSGMGLTARELSKRV